MGAFICRISFPHCSLARMSSTGKAISRAYNGAHDETSEVRSHSRGTSSQGQPPLASSNSTSDDSVLIVDWNGPDDPENPRKCGLISVLSLPSSHHFTIRSWKLRQKWEATVIVLMCNVLHTSSSRRKDVVVRKPRSSPSVRTTFSET